MSKTDPNDTLRDHGNDAVRDEFDHTPDSRADAHKVFRRWLGDDYDLDTLDAMLAVGAVHDMDGDPVWLMIISGSGNAKTETVQTLSEVGAHVVSTIASEGALLSGAKRVKGGTGGLLRQIGDRGILAVKDFTSILSMSNRDARAAVLAALREIHDGRWVRYVGSEGGRMLQWPEPPANHGRVTVIGACTTAWDQAHSVIAAMGERFLLIRSDSHLGRESSAQQAIRNTGAETQMRAELAAAVAAVITAANKEAVYSPTDDDQTTIIGIANLATLARTAVELDYRGDVIDAHAPEMPTRFAKQLTQILRGAIAIGLSHKDAMRLVVRCARDSVPELRLRVLKDVADHPDTRVIDVRRRMQKPRTTIDRTLQALQYLGLLVCNEKEQPHGDTVRQVRHYRISGNVQTRWLYTMHSGVKSRGGACAASVPEM